MSKRTRGGEDARALLLSSTTSELSSCHAEEHGLTPIDAAEAVEEAQSHGSAVLDSWSCLTYASALSASLGGLLFGYDMGIISGAKSQLRHDLHLSCLQIELIVTALPMGAFVSSLVAGGLVDKMGRRNSIVGNAILFTLGGMVTAMADSVAKLIFGRLVLGFSIALSVTAECVYLSEISAARHRGAMVTLNELAITMGVLVAFLVNYILAKVESGWRLMFGLSCLFSLLQTLLMLCMPQTPHFLLMTNREEEARQSLRRLNITDDVDQAIKTIRQSIHLQASTTSLYSKIGCNEDNMRLRFVVALGLVFFQQFTGQPNIIYYAADVFRQLGFCDEWHATLATVGLGLVKMALTIVALNIVDKIGRRLSLFIGISIMLACLLVLAAFALNQGDDFRDRPCEDDLDSEHPEASICNPTSSASWIAFAALITYVGAFSIGFGPVTWLVLSELFPPNVKGNAMANASAINWLGNVVVSQTFMQSIGAIIRSDLLFSSGFTEK